MRFLLPLLLVVTACTSTSLTSARDTPATVAAPIQLSMSLYVVDIDEGAPESALSSQRTLAELNDIAERMQTIWDQAGIELVVETIERIEAPAEAVSDLSRGETATFLNGVYSGAIAVPATGSINGFYVRSLGGINGIAPIGTRVFFVTDDPSVHDERVSSHEIGHILGLHHAIDDSERLMFSGTNGMALSEVEIGTSRYAAQGIVDGIR